jgi:hypothetical protein
MALLASIYLPIRLRSHVLQVYDLAITVDEEVEFVWKQPWSWMTWIFLLCRYTPLADNGFIPLIRKKLDSFSGCS